MKWFKRAIKWLLNGFKTKYEYHEPELIFQGPPGTPMVNVVVKAPEGMLVIMSNVFHGPNRTKAWLRKNGETAWNQVYDAELETMAGGMKFENKIIFTNEGGRNVIEWYDGAFHNGVSTPGEYGGGMMVRNGIPVISYNNNYGADKQMHDNPNIIYARTGEASGLTIPKNCFCFRMACDGDQWYGALSCGFNGLFVSPEGYLPGDVNAMSILNGRLYIGAGSWTG